MAPIARANEVYKRDGEKIEETMSRTSRTYQFNHVYENNAIPNTNCHPERSEAKPSAVEGPAVSLGDLSSAVGQPLAELLRCPEIIIEIYCQSCVSWHQIFSS